MYKLLQNYKMTFIYMSVHFNILFQKKKKTRPFSNQFLNKWYTWIWIFQPIKQIGEEVRQLNLSRKALPKILLHTDAAQAIGKIEVDVEDLGIDYLTIVGHKVF